MDMEFDKCGRCGRHVPERELEYSNVYGLVCEDCFWKTGRDLVRGRDYDGIHAVQEERPDGEESNQ